MRKEEGGGDQMREGAPWRQEAEVELIPQRENSMAPHLSSP